MKFRNIAKLIGWGLLTALFAVNAEARECANENDTSCWEYISGTTGQVASGRNGNNDGIFCAVDANAANAWGGSMICYKATSAPGGYYKDGYAGESYGSPYFSDHDDTKRMVAVAIAPGYTATGVVIHVLRSDGVMFYAFVDWPLPLDGNLTIDLVQDFGTPANARSLSVDDFNHFLLINTSNQKFTWAGIGYTSVGMDSSTVLAAGHLNDATVLLYGTTGTTLAVAEFGPNIPNHYVSLPNLPRALTGATSDPNTSFNADAVGIPGSRQTPLASTGTTNNLYTWAVLPGTCGGTNIPCIYRSSRGRSTLTWSGWSRFSTNWMSDPSVDPAFPMPTTVQDGFAMHGRFDELLVVAGYDRLYAWIP